MTNHAETAKELFEKGYNCAQAVLCAFSDVTGYDLDTSARMASSFRSWYMMPLLYWMR